MSERDHNPQIFRIPSTRGWDDVAIGFLARVEALPLDCVLDVRIADRHREVAWVSIYRSSDDTITASGPHGPYTTRGQTAWTWHPAASDPAESLNQREIERTEHIARSILDFVASIDGVPDADEFGMKAAAHFRTWSPHSGPAPAAYNWDGYAEHRTGLQINSFLHYLHFIPMGNGLTKKHVDRYFPGWTSELLVETLKAADVFVGRGGSPPHCRPTVKAIRFTGPRHWAVEWLDGTVTTST